MGVQASRLAGWREPGDRATAKLHIYNREEFLFLFEASAAAMEAACLVMDTAPSQLGNPMWKRKIIENWGLWGLQRAWNEVRPV